MKQKIPHLLTLLNLFCGCVATVYAVQNQLEWAALFVFAGIFFDFFDGMAARLLNAQSELGIQLDSLADMITSGLVPGIVMFQLLAMSQSGGWNAISWQEFQATGQLWHANTIFPFLGFLITLASAYRLARFNIDEDQVDSFTGLPTPANAILVLSLPLILLYQSNDTINAVILSPWFLLGHVVLSSYLLNSNIEMFALKFKNWSFKDNALRYVFVVLSLVLLLTIKFMAIPAIIALYIVSSLVNQWDIRTKTSP